MRFYFTLLCISIHFLCKAQYTNSDTLRGSDNANRNFWDVQYYDITIEPNYSNKSIVGKCTIQFSVVETKSNAILQIDLQHPLVIDSVLNDKGQQLSFLAKAEYYEVDYGSTTIASSNSSVTIYYHGIPQEAINPPWDGGMVWTRDDEGNPWISVSCQHKGASVWYPCKDVQWDEPNKGMSLSMITDKTVTAIGNGKKISEKPFGEKKITTYAVTNPINNYNISFNIGKYGEIQKEYKGVYGNLQCTFNCLAQNTAKAEKKWKDIFEMLAAFEKAFGPYPWYEDGYKLVETPFLGMEHQSAIAYGNYYMKGYLGKDLSGTGHGKSWDYIIVHESGHEWWGNHVSTKDIADMWIHEGFTTYSEAIFVEHKFGKKAATEYVVGLRNNIEGNDKLISDYGVNQQPSGDVYAKGANILHCIRQVLNNDSLFFATLQAIQKKYGSSTCTSKDIEQFFCQYTSINLQPIFDQYLRTADIPKIKISANGKKSVSLSMSNCNQDFVLPFWYFDGKELKKVNISSNEKVNVSLKKSTYKAFVKSLNQAYYVEFLIQ
jgi:aminopeptidase N